MRSLSGGNQVSISEMLTWKGSTKLGFLPLLGILTGYTAQRRAEHGLESCESSLFVQWQHQSGNIAQLQLMFIAVP